MGANETIPIRLPSKTKKNHLVGSCVALTNRRPTETPASSGQNRPSSRRDVVRFSAQETAMLEFRDRSEDRAAKMLLEVFWHSQRIIPVIYQERGAQADDKSQKQTQGKIQGEVWCCWFQGDGNEAHDFRVLQRGVGGL